MVELLRPEQLRGKSSSSEDSGKENTSSTNGRAEKEKSALINVRKGFLRVVKAPFKTKRRRIITFSFLFVLVLLTSAVVVVPAAVLYPKAEALKQPVRNLKVALDERNLDAIEAHLLEVESKFKDLENAYQKLSYLRFVPIANKYYSDGTHFLEAGRLGIESGEIIVSSVKPYKEVLGLGGGFGSQITVEQQLANILGTLPKVAEDLDQVWTNLSLIEAELEEIDATRYPKEARGVKVRFWIEESQRILAESKPLISEGRRLLEIVPDIFGASGKRTYLVIFQNDAELRATGGFITGFSLITIKDGKVLENEFHAGSYVAKTTPFINPPAPVGKYLKVPTWHFQDANFSPDFPTSAKNVLDIWRKSDLGPVDGVVGITTQTAGRVLDITGPTSLEGYDQDLSSWSGLPDSCKSGGRHFTGENLVCRLEYYTERSPQSQGKGAEDRKAFLGDLSDKVINKLVSSPAESWARLVDLGFELLRQKDLMVYFNNSEEQDLIKSLDYAARIKDYNGDYLHISDSNFGGKKADMFMQEEVEQVLERREDGTWRKTVKIKYYNPQPYDDWLSANYKDFVRIYTPRGSRLVSVEGASQIWTSPNNWSTQIAAPKGWSEFGKSVFGAYFTVWPQTEHTLTFVYDLPSSAMESWESDGVYKLLMQKQPATNIGLVKVRIGDIIETTELTTDKEFTITKE